MNQPQFIRSSALHVVEVAEESLDALSKSAQLGTDVRRTEIESTEFAPTDHQAERKPLSFDHSSTLPGSPPSVLHGLEVSPSPQPNTSARAAAPTSAAWVAKAGEPAPRSQVQSHFSDQISQLKAENNHVRAALQRRESAPSTKA